jgi:predicted ATPase
MPERLFQLDIPGLQVEFPPLRTARPSAGNLPLRVTSFLGRDQELHELQELLEENRLLTLTGPGGIGKTSLAVELARSRVETLPDGAWFVALDSLTDPGVVRALIARTLGLFDGPDRPAAEAIERYLADRSTLLVLDNFEHLIGASGVVADLLRASPKTRIVVTSRAPLRIAGEQEYPVRPLAVGSKACSALFIQRARAIRPGWDAGADAPVVDEVCGLLDGLPLGLELAAARVSLMPVRAIRDRLAARLPLPGSGPRDAPNRQRTLEGAIAWSHDLLSPAEQRLLQDLAVFEGSFDVEQVAAVSGEDVFDGLAALVDQSLVTREIGDDPDAIRFRLLQVIRRFATEKLQASGREPELRQRHAAAYLALAEKAAPFLPGREQPRLLARLALDQDNLRGAVQWAIDNAHTELALQLVGALWRFWQLDGHLVEGRTLVEAALAMPGADEPTKARLQALTAAGGVAYWDGRSEEALRLYAEQLELARVLADPVSEVDAIFNLTYGRFLSGDREGALDMILDARDRYRLLGDDRGAARAEWARATAHLQADDPAEAEVLFAELLGTFERLDDAWYHAMTLGSLAWTNFGLGNVHEAGRWLVRGFAETHALKDRASTVVNLPATAIMAIQAGHIEDAAVILGAVESLGVRYGVVTPPGLDRLILGKDPDTQVLDALGAEKVAAAKERGRRLSIDEAAELVMRIGAEMERAGPQ